MSGKISLHIDDESEIRIQRVRQYLPAENDLGLIALKGHLLAEEVLDDVIRFYCKQPEHLEDIEMRFLFKARIARALSGCVVCTGFWRLIDSLNELRDDLARNQDNHKLQDRVEKFLKLRKEVAPLLNEQEIDLNDSDAVANRFRSDISLLLGEIMGAGMLTCTLQIQALPCEKNVSFSRLTCVSTV